MATVRSMRQYEKMKDTLWESEELYQKLLVSIPDLVFRTDVEGRILFINDVALHVSGYAKEEIIGQSFLTFLVPEDRPRALSNMKLMFEKPLGPIAYRVTTRDGRIIDLEANGDVLRNEDGSPFGMVQVCRDITERKHIEQALRESEKRLASIIDSLPEPALVIDCEGKVVAWNRAVEKMTGVKAADILGKNNYEYAIPFYGYRRPTLIDFVLNPEANPEEVYPGLISEGDSLYGEAHIPQLGDGKMYVWGAATAIRDTDSNIIGAIETLRDISARRQAEQDLIEWQERYRLLSEASFEGIAITDQGIFIDANGQLLDMLGYRLEDIIGRPVSDVIAPEWVDLVMKHIRESYEEPYEHCLLRKDGTTFPVESRARMMFWRGEKYRVTIIKDLTVVKEAEERRSHLEAQIFQSQKLESLGTLAGGIAHDFNNLLMAIQGYTSLVQLDFKPGQSQYERLKNIEKQVRSGADLTRQLLGFARGGKYEVRPTRINDLLQQNSEMFSRTKREIGVHSRFADDIWTVEVDRSQMDQVFLNIYINAWQAMPAGGNLFIETKNIILDNHFVRPYGIEPGRYVKISVTDTGTGMDEKTLQRVFEPFFTTKEIGRGYGLGLASAYGIVRNHSGVITAYSQRGYGTTFNVYLPASGVLEEQEPVIQEAIVCGSETIMVVDDDSANIEVISQILITLGYKVIIAHDGLEAIELYKKNIGIDLVILDMIMPGLGGGDTFDRIKKINPSVRVILSSGYSATGQAKTILDRGVNAFIQKPFTAAEFSKKIRDVLNK